MSRKTAQPKCLEQFPERNNLNLCWDHALVTQGNTYANYALNQYSCIDHFVMNCNMFSRLRTCDVNSSPLNPSDHRDIHASWNRTIGYQNVRQNRPARDKCAWYRATDENIINYQHQLDVLLDQLCVDTNALTCDDQRCENDGNRKSVEELCEFLINSCLCAGKHTLPKCTPSRGQVPLWNERIKPLKDDSLFWHWLWKEAGRPPAGALAAVMRYTRASYHRAVKIHKRDEIKNRRTIIADCAKHNKRDLWSELRKLDSVGKPAPSIIDSCTNDTDIANIFAKKYNDLYKSFPTPATEIAELHNTIARDIPCGDSSYLTGRVSVDDIVNTLSMLKKGKSDGLRGTDSDHFIQCSHRFKVSLSQMITSMLTHGYTPTGLLEAVITSIPKDLRQC